MIDLRQIALMVLQNNPNMANNPKAKEFADVIKTGDQKRGEELARSLCEERGVKPEEAVQQAMQFFNIK